MNTPQLREIAFVCEEFSARSPVQQLLDRFLIGYPKDGEFRRMDGCRIVLASLKNEESAEVKSRVREFGLEVVSGTTEAVADADAVVVVWRGSGANANHGLLESVLEATRPGVRCFVHGALANDLSTARKFAEIAARRGLALCSGASTGVTFRLPDVEIPMGARVREGLIVVQGPFADAEFEALDGLLPSLARRRNGEAGVCHIRFLAGDTIWEAGKVGEWSWPLLAAAISRSNTVQGDPLRDGRTQDVVGLGLVPALSKNPRCWLLEHRDGIKSTILVLDGVVADFNLAVRLADGSMVSSQLYRPPPPMQEQFSRLAAVIEQFFRSGAVPWPLERSLVMASLLDAFAKPEARTGRKVEILRVEPKL